MKIGASVSDNYLELKKQIQNLTEKEKQLSKELVEYNIYFDVKEKTASKYSDPRVVLSSLKVLKNRIKEVEESLDTIYDTKISLKKQLKKEEKKTCRNYIKNKIKNLCLTRKK